MADIVRRADVVWRGNLIEGTGTFHVGSGAMTAQAVSWPARTEGPGGKTSPEELLAASHASCYAMAFSHTLAEAGHPPEELRVSASVTFEPLPAGGFKVGSSSLSVEGVVPGLDQAGFRRLWPRRARRAARSRTPFAGTWTLPSRPRWRASRPR